MNYRFKFVIKKIRNTHILCSFTHILQEADIAVAPTTWNSMREKVVDFSVPFFVVGVGESSLMFNILNNFLSEGQKTPIQQILIVSNTFAA